MPHRSFCETCHAERLHEQPPCTEGHGDDCPEWVCTGCGDATLLGPVDPIAVPLPRAA